MVRGSEFNSSYTGWRADFNRNLIVNGDDYDALYAIKSGNTIGDSLE